MRKLLSGMAASIALCAPASVARSQNFNDFAAWAALVNTPVGAFSPVLLVPTETGPALGTVFQLRYGHWKFEGAGNSQNNFGAGVSIPSGRARWGFELGLGSINDCDGCGHMLMFGVDATIPLTAAPTRRGTANTGVFAVAINPVAGLGKPVGGDDGSSGFALSVGVNVPVSVSFKVGERAHLVPFLAPGAGLGHINDDDDSETGFRFMLGGGLTLAEITPGLQLTGSFRKIFIDNGPTTFGLGLTIAGR